MQPNTVQVKQHVIICMQAHISKFLIVRENTTSATCRGSRPSSWTHVRMHGMQQPKADSSKANLVEMFCPCPRHIWLLHPMIQIK